MNKYIKPKIRIRHIAEDKALLAASGEMTGEPSNDLGTTFGAGTVTGDKALSKPRINWDEEEGEY